MEKENLIWLKDFVKYRTINPFEDSESDNKVLIHYRDKALDAVKQYKYEKSRLELKQKENLIINNVLSELQKQINNYDN
jgi:hypothetical protein